MGPYGLSTQRVSFEPVYDPSGTDYLYTRITISVSAIMAETLVPGIGGETPTQTMVRIQHLLQTPRRGLSFVVGSDSLVAVGSTGSIAATQQAALDAKNGPVPGACHITRIQGDKAFRIDWSVSAHVVDCAEAGQGPAYVSYRYTETDDINRLGMTRRTRSGVIITRSDMLTSPDAFRGLVSPALEPEFLRISSNYSLSPDGLSLSYTFVDEEQYLMPPDPAAEADGDYIEGTVQGAMRSAEVRVMLRAGKTDNRGVLLARALSVAMAKIELADPVRQNPGGGGVGGGDAGGAILGARIQTESPPILQIATIREKLYANEVEVRLRAICQPSKKVYGKVNTDLSRFAKPPAGSSKGEFSGFDVGTRGTAQLGIIAAALQDPCLRQVTIGTTPQPPSVASLRGSTVPATVTISAVQPTSDDAKISTTESGVYTNYSIKTRDVRDENRLQIPVGKPGQSCVIIRTANTTTRRIYEWEATKIGSVPTCPDPNPSPNSNAVLMERHIDPGQVEVMPDGTTLKYMVSGRYEYAFKDSSKVVLAGSIPPWISSDVAYLEGQKSVEFKAGVIDVDGNGYGGGSQQANLRTV